MLGDPLSARNPSQPSASAGCPEARSTAYESRAALFRQVLAAERIALPELRALAFDGLPEEKGLRAVVWKASLPTELPPGVLVLKR